MSKVCASRFWMGLVLLAMGTAAPVWAVDRHVTREASGWVEESSGPLPADKALEVTRFVGAVNVVSGSPNPGWVLKLHSAEATEQNAKRQFAGYHLGVSRKGNGTLVQTVGPVDLTLRAELIIRVPPSDDNIHVDSLGGKITIHGKVSHLELQTHGGDIEIDDADLLRAVAMAGSVIVNHRLGDSYIRTDGGDIRVDASTGDLEIYSLGGNIWLKAIARGRVHSGGGNIEVVRCAGALLVRTAGGKINLGEMDGPVTAESGGGSIRVGVAHGAVIASTAMGDIELWKLSQGAEAHTGMGRITAEFVGDRKTMHDSQLVTTMGDIITYFSSGVPATLRAVAGSSPSQRIFSDFPELKVVTGMPDYGPRSIALFGAIHGGGPAVDLRTMAGQIVVRSIR